jgi:hypothetical protein
MVVDGLMWSWTPVSQPPELAGAYLVFMPKRTLDQYSVQHFDHLDGWTNDFGITHWCRLPDRPHEPA